MEKDNKSKLDIKTIINKMLKALSVIQRNLHFIFVVIILVVYSFLVFRIGVLSNAEPTTDEVDEITKDIKKGRIDKEAVDTILKLESENILVKTLFQEARDNPFVE